MQQCRSQRNDVSTYQSRNANTPRFSQLSGSGKRLTSTTEVICATSRRLPAFPSATRKSMSCVNESISPGIGRCERMAKKLDGILVEVNGGLVFSVEVDGELASRMTDSNTRPAHAGEERTR